MAEKKKVLLMGKTGAGKTSMRCIIFANYIAQDTRNISPTIEVEHSHVRFLGNLNINIWDCGGQGTFMKNFLGFQRENIFTHVDIFVFVFNVESLEFVNDLATYVSCLACLKVYSPNAHLFCFVHKVDLIPLSEQVAVFQERADCILKATRDWKCNLYATTIWDESLFKAWSDATKLLVTNVEQIEKNLSSFAEKIEADEILIFEKYTLLIIFRCERKAHSDPNRFQKISNIIKQFRASCSKVTANLKSIEVRNSRFAAYIENFTTNTYIMVVTSDPSIRMTLTNIKNGRKCFEILEGTQKKSLLAGTSSSSSK